MKDINGNEISLSHIEIKSLDKDGSICQELYIDGNHIKGVRSLEFKSGIESEIPTLTIDLNAFSISIDSYVKGFMKGESGQIKNIEFWGEMGDTKAPPK